MSRPGPPWSLPLTVLALIGAAAVGVAATAASPGSRASPIRAQASFSGGFLPGRVVVRPGAVVHFRNTDGLRHNAVAERLVRGRPAFTSGAPTTHGFHFRAPRARGSYSYVCQVHGFMQGTLVVR